MPPRASLCALRVRRAHFPLVAWRGFADFADRDTNVFGTKAKAGQRGRYWDDRLQCWTDKPSPAIERLNYSEATMPGDLADLGSIGIAEVAGGYQIKVEDLG